MSKLTGVLLLLCSTAVFATEIEFSVGTSNQPLGRERFLADDAITGLEFPFIGGDLMIKGELGDGMGYRVGFIQSPVIGRIFLSEMVFDSPYFHLSMGPYYGMVNTLEEWISPGITAGIRWDVPGFFYLGMNLATNFSLFNDVGDYRQERNTFEAGLYIPNGILKIDAIMEDYLEIYSDTRVTHDEMMDIRFTLETFTKFLPIRLEFMGGFLRFEKNFIEATTTTYSYFTIITGLGFTHDVTPDFNWFLRGDISIYPFTEGEFFKNETNGYPLYGAELGMQIAF